MALNKKIINGNLETLSGFYPCYPKSKY